VLIVAVAASTATTVSAGTDGTTGRAALAICRLEVPLAIHEDATLTAAWRFLDSHALQDGENDAPELRSAAVNDVVVNEPLDAMRMREVAVIAHGKLDTFQYGLRRQRPFLCLSMDTWMQMLTTSITMMAISMYGIAVCITPSRT
jgi:hypothetical protein